jgi:hypothetical protein
MNKRYNGMEQPVCGLSVGESGRYLNPNDIVLQAGYDIEVFYQWLDVPSRIAFNDEGDILIALSGYVSKNPSIIKLHNGAVELVADGFDPPLTGMSYYNGNIYVTHFGKLTIVYPNGSKQDILEGIPNYGDYWSSNVAIGPDGKLYFGIGTATNSGVVGTDNEWALNYPYFYDNPGEYEILTGVNYETENMFLEHPEPAYTGAFSPYGIPNMPYEVRKGILMASGSIVRVNPDGTQMEQVAWGFRYPSTIKFDNANRLYASNQSYEVRGSRPIANAPNEFHLVIPGQWYGWPDYADGELVNSEKFKPEGEKQPELLLFSHPGTPPSSIATFSSNSDLVSFDFNYNTEFGPYGDVYIAEYGSGGRIVSGTATPFTGEGFRVSQISMSTGAVSTLAMNKSGFTSSVTHDGGFGRQHSKTLKSS